MNNDAEIALKASSSRNVRRNRKPALLADGNPQIAKGDGDAPVQACIAGKLAMFTALFQQGV